MTYWVQLLLVDRRISVPTPVKLAFDSLLPRVRLRCLHFRARVERPLVGLGCFHRPFVSRDRGAFRFQAKRIRIDQALVGQL